MSIIATSFLNPTHYQRWVWIFCRYSTCHFSHLIFNAKYFTQQGPCYHKKRITGLFFDMYLKIKINHRIENYSMNEFIININIIFFKWCHIYSCDCSWSFFCNIVCDFVWAFFLMLECLKKFILQPWIRQHQYTFETDLSTKFVDKPIEGL